MRLATVSGQRQDKEAIFNPIWRLRGAISHARSAAQQLHSHRPSKTFRTVRHSYALFIPSLQNYVLPQKNTQHFISANTLSHLQIAPAHVCVSPQRLPSTGLASSTIHSNGCSAPRRLADNWQQLRPCRATGNASFKIKDGFMLHSVSSVPAKT